MTTNDQPNDGFPVRSPDYREGFLNAMRAMNLIYGQPAPAAGSDTPRTDEQINGKPCTRFAVFAGDSLRDALVRSEFARQLERELADAEHSNMNHRDYIGRLEVDRKDLRAQLATALAESAEWQRSFYVAKTNHEVTLADLLREQRDGGDTRLQLAAAQAKIAELEQDKARLDWLLSRCTVGTHVLGRIGQTHYSFRPFFTLRVQGGGREGIDDAMQNADALAAIERKFGDASRSSTPVQP
jgi:hypothetical protein